MTTTTLSESASKQLLSEFGVRLAREQLVDSPSQAATAATAIGFPVVVKVDGPAIAHKTERGLVRLNLGSPEATESAASQLLAATTEADGAVRILVAEQVRGNRELIAGVATDAVFGQSVMLGVGGILAEAVADVVFRMVPITRDDAYDMIDQLATQKLLGPFRGEPAVDRQALADVLVGLSSATHAHPEICSVDLNPLIVRASDGAPVAVDALVEVNR